MAKKKKMTRKERKAAAAVKRQAMATTSQKAPAQAKKQAPSRASSSARPAKRHPRKQRNFFQRLFYETRGELQKVSWPTREEAWRLTVVVTVVTVFMAAFLGFFDWLFTRLFALILG